MNKPSGGPPAAGQSYWIAMKAVKAVEPEHKKQSSPTRISQTWRALEAYIGQQIEELQCLLQDSRYIRRHARIQQLLAVMVAREQEVHVLAVGERDGGIDPYVEAQARARLRMLRSTL